MDRENEIKRFSFLLRELKEDIIKLTVERDKYFRLYNNINGEKEPKQYQSFQLMQERVISKDIRYHVLKRQKWRCNSCSQVLKMNKNSGWDGEVGHIDHIHPFADRATYPKGPSYINEADNLQGLCPQCNLKKGKTKQ